MTRYRLVLRGALPALLLFAAGVPAQEGEALFERACEVLFSPSSAELPARDLADWIVGDRLPVRMQIQLHKYLWGDQPGR